jgi:hypothetical protein
MADVTGASRTTVLWTRSELRIPHSPPPPSDPSWQLLFWTWPNIIIQEKWHDSGLFWDHTVFASVSAANMANNKVDTWRSYPEQLVSLLARQMARLPSNTHAHNNNNNNNNRLCATAPLSTHYGAIHTVAVYSSAVVYIKTSPILQF